MPGRNSIRAYLGLGGNLGDPAASMAAALRAVDKDADTSVAEVSSLYRTPPWGLSDQPDFLNAVAAVDSTRNARELLDLCLSIEAGLKRVRTERWGPRLIDVDILLFGDQRIDEPGLQVPHPRMAQRAFVLLPLAEVSSGLLVGGETVERLAEMSDKTGIERLPGGRDWWRAV